MPIATPKNTLETTQAGVRGRAAILLFLCLGLAACPRPVQPPAPPPVVPSPTEPSPPPTQVGAANYEIEPRSSVLHVLVYRGGMFARLGHNHVMSSKSVTGRIWMRPALSASGFELTLPVADLIVDDPDARRAAGDEFPPEIPAADREGTRKNMLRKEVLDAENYPIVTVKSAAISGSLPTPQITIRITLKDTTRELVVPTSVAVQGDRLTASGEFELSQTDFGMKPFSVALGALTVKDRLQVRFALTATSR